MGGHYKEEQEELSLAFGDHGDDLKLYLAYLIGQHPLLSSLVRLYLMARVPAFLRKNLGRVIRIEQPFSNHNGAHLEFGPDGYLLYRCWR